MASILTDLIESFARKARHHETVCRELVSPEQLITCTAQQHSAEETSKGLEVSSFPFDRQEVSQKFREVSPSSDGLITVGIPTKFILSRNF